MPDSVTRSSPRAHARALLLGTALLLLTALLALPAAAEARKAPGKFFGVSAVKPSAADFQGMAKLGAKSYRVEVPWPASQSSRNGPFHFGGSDQRFFRAAQNGMRPVPILLGTPAFISGDSEHIRGPIGRDARREWKDFVVAAINRYKRGGTFWKANPQLNGRLAPKSMIFWNEQNARSFWWPRANPKQFGKVLKATSKALNRVAPKMKVFLGGMFGFPDHKNSMNAKKFLKKVYKQRGTKRRIDGVSVHPYSGNLRGMKKQVKDVRKVFQRFRDRRAKIVVGEFGWSSHGNKRSPIVKSKRGQKKMLKRSFRYFLKKRRKWNIDSIYWYTYKDFNSDEFCLWCSGAGLVNRNSKIKPAGKAYKQIVRKKSR